MNRVQIEQFETRLKGLEDFVETRQGVYHESEIIDWIAECVNIFYEIGVDSVIIRNFLDHFRSRTETIEVERFIGGGKDNVIVKVIGPFQEEVLSGGYHYRSGRYILAGSFYYAKVGFSAAHNTLKNKGLV